jgi:prophage tail gpP-like protein
VESSSGQKARSHILIELLDDDVSQTRTQIVIQNDVRETDYVKNQRVKRVKQRKQWEFTDIYPT